MQSVLAIGAGKDFLDISCSNEAVPVKNNFLCVQQRKLRCSSTFFPIIEKVLLKLLDDEVGNLTYQGVELINYTEALDYLKTNFSKYVDSVFNYLSDRFKCQNVELLTHAIKVLATHEWDKTEDGYDTIAYFRTRFSVLHKHANVDSLLQQDWDDMVDYGKMQ